MLYLFIGVNYVIYIYVINVNRNVVLYICMCYKEGTCGVDVKV